MREDVDNCLIFMMYFSFLFSGYVGSKSFLQEVLQVVHQLREANPNLVFGT